MRDRAFAQQGLVGRDELRAVGASRQAVANRLRSPDWEEVTRRVLRLVGTAASGEQRAMAAVLDAGGGAVVSHGAAAALWGLPGFDLGAIHVSRRRGASGRTTALATLHHPGLLPPAHCGSRHGIPTTGLARTVVDLAATEHPARVELAAHAAVRLGVPWSALGQVLDEVGARGHPGTAAARSVLEAGSGRRPLGSGLEGRFLRLLPSAGLPEPRRQVDVGANLTGCTHGTSTNGCGTGRSPSTSSRSTAAGTTRARWTSAGTSAGRRRWRRPGSGSSPSPRTSSAGTRPRPSGSSARHAGAPAGQPVDGTTRIRGVSSTGTPVGGQRPMAPAARSSAMAQPKAMR